MAENSDNPSFSFGIDNTIEMGMGNPELLEGLLGPETASGDPDNLKKIVKEVDEPVPTKPTKAKPIVPIEGEEQEKVTTGQDLLAKYLSGEDTEEGKSEETPVANEEEIPSEEGDNQNQFAAMTQDLLKLGVFTSDEGEEEPAIATPEDFLERFKNEKIKGAREILDNFIGQFGEDYQQAFEAIYVKGADPKEYFGTYNKIVNFAELDLSQEQNQMAVMKQSLTDQGLEPEDVTDEVERLKNYGDLESVSIKHHKVLVKKEALKLQQLEQKAEHELQQKNAIKTQYVENVNTILQEKLKTKEFDGIPLNPKLVNELQDFLLVEKYKIPSSGETLTEFDRSILELKRPENHAMKIKVALLLKILEKDPTLSTIQRSGVTKKSDQLFSEMARQTSKAVNPVKQNKGNSWFS